MKATSHGTATVRPRPRVVLGRRAGPRRDTQEIQPQEPTPPAETVREAEKPQPQPLLTGVAALLAAERLLMAAVLPKLQRASELNVGEAAWVEWLAAYRTDETNVVLVCAMKGLTFDRIAGTANPLVRFKKRVPPGHPTSNYYTPADNPFPYAAEATLVGTDGSSTTSTYIFRYRASDLVSGD